LAGLITGTVFLVVGLATIITAQARWKDRPNDSAQVAITPTARTADYARQDDAISTFPEATATVRQDLGPLEKPLTDLPNSQGPKPIGSSLKRPDFGSPESCRPGPG
jgi:hypothetical protein